MACKCPICLDVFEPHDKIYCPPCGHTLHDRCIIDWFTRSKTCPSCRREITTAEGFRRVHLNIFPDTGILAEKIESLELCNKLNEKELEIYKNKYDKLKLENQGLKNGIRVLNEYISKTRNAIKSHERCCEQNNRRSTIGNTGIICFTILAVFNIILCIFLFCLDKESFNIDTVKKF